MITPTFRTGERVSETEYAGVLDTLYAASTAPELWPGVVERMSGLFGGPTGLLTYRFGDENTSRLLAASFDPEFLRAHDDYYRSVNILIRTVPKNRPPVLTGEHSVPARELKRTELYELLNTHDLLHSFNGFVGLYDDLCLDFVSMRPERSDTTATASSRSSTACCRTSQSHGRL